eukprot:1613748-Rhodomonas_salina.3
MLAAYARATQCPVLRLCMVLPATQCPVHSVLRRRTGVRSSTARARASQYQREKTVPRSVAKGTTSAADLPLIVLQVPLKAAKVPFSEPVVPFLEAQMP